MARKGEDVTTRKASQYMARRGDDVTTRKASQYMAREANCNTRMIRETTPRKADDAEGKPIHGAEGRQCHDAEGKPIHRDSTPGSSKGKNGTASKKRSLVRVLAIEGGHAFSRIELHYVVLPAIDLVSRADETRV